MSSVTGLELPNAWRTAQADNPSFDISADQLNTTANRELWIPSGTIDWQGALMRNALDPVLAQDLATKNYVDTNAGTIWSTFPAQQNVDYVSTFKNINLIEPTDPQDSATKNYVDTQLGAIALDDLVDVIITTPQSNEIIQFNGTEWVNQPISVPAGSQITQGNSSVSVIDTGVGRIESVIDNILKLNIESSQITMFNPLIMSGQAINNLQTPTSGTDAANKDYVDTQVATKPSDLDGLTDVTITTPLVNQVLVNNGSGQFVNQILGKSQLPSEIAYEDEVNTFTMNNVFQVGLQVAVDQALDMAGGFILDTKYMDFAEQGSDPADPALDDARLFLETAPSFGLDDPQLAVLINRGGSITKKPIPTSETIFALNQFSNGMVTDETGVRLSDNNPTIRLQMFNEANSANTFDVVLEGDIYTIPSPDTSPGTSNTIELTEGTDTVPVKHWVWIELQLGVPVMASNTVGFPSGQDLIVVGTFTLQSRVSIFANNAGGNPYAVNSPDYEIKDVDIRGHLAHINDRLVELDSAYIDGIVITTAPIVGGGTATAVTYSTTSGRGFELHVESIEAFDITAVDSIALVQNNQAVPGEVNKVVNLSADLLGMICNDGVDVMYASNNDTANLVLFTIHNDNEPNTTNYGINLPQTQYTNDDAAAIADTSNFAIKNVPLTLRGIAMLIAEVVVKFTTGGNYEVLAVKDLRGQIPGAAGGSGGGAGGATQLNDLTDVTIATALINESLVNDGAGQFVNKLTPQLETVNVWTESQTYTPFAIGTGPSGTDGQFYTELIDATNTGLFVNLQVAGVVTKLRLA